MKELKWSATHFCAISLLLLSALGNDSSAAPGDVDPSFDAGSGINGGVAAIARQPDGKLIIGGRFTAVKGLVRTNLARLNADGSGDSTFTAAPLNYPVYSLALQSDGKVLVGSDYGVNFGLTRVNTDGSPDTNFNANVYTAIFPNQPYYPGQIATIVVQPDGKVFYAGETLLRFNSNGTLDTNFNSAASGYIYSMALQPDGKLLVGGYLYDNQNGGYSYGLARLNTDGSLDNTFDGAAAQIGLCLAIVVQPDGKVLVGGKSIGTNSACVVRLNGNGTVDATFAEVLGATNQVTEIGLQPDGKMVIGGFFVFSQGHSRTNLARLNLDGSLDSSFNSDIGPDFVGVAAVVVQPDGKVIVGGGSAFGAGRYVVVRLNAGGSLDGSFDPGRNLNVPVSSVVVQPDGKVLIGDVFTFINGANRYASARLNGNGSVDGTFISDTNFRPNLLELNLDGCGPQSCACTKHAVPFVLLAQPDGKVLIGFRTETIIECPDGGDVIFSHVLARFNADGSFDGSFYPVRGWSAGFGMSRALALQPDGKILVGGSFGAINGTNRHGIARLNANGSLDGIFQNGMSGVRDPGGYSGRVEAVAAQPDGKVLIAGSFTTVNGTNRNNIARLNADGSLDNSFNPGTGISGQVLSIAMQPDGKVLIGGSFTSVNSTNRNNIARLNANGSLDSTFNPGQGANGPVGSIALQADGKVLISGDFTSVNGLVRPRVARLYGDLIPSLSIARSNAFLIVSWPVSGTNFRLEENMNLSLSNGWSAVAETRSTNNNSISVTLPATGSRKFFRLSSP